MATTKKTTDEEQDQNVVANETPYETHDGGATGRAEAQDAKDEADDDEEEEPKDLTPGVNYFEPPVADPAFVAQQTKVVNVSDEEMHAADKVEEPEAAKEAQLRQAGLDEEADAYADTVADAAKEKAAEEKAAAK
jgi:hypothetical protein